MKPFYKEKYPHLFSPMYVGKKRISFKNRVIVPPISNGGILADLDGRINADGVEFFGQFARGGFASVTVPTEVPLNGGHLGMISVSEEVDGFVPMHNLQNVVHAYRARSFLEIYHAGACMLPGNGRKLMSSSAMTYNGRQIAEMTEQDMEDVIREHVRTAGMAVRAGFDGICLHFAHGWLMNQFLSPLVNHRTDRFGGSIENNARFPRMLLEALRRSMGDALLIELRLSCSDRLPGGITPEMAAEHAVIFEDLVDMIHVSSSTRIDASTRPYMHPIGYLPRGVNVEGSMALKKRGIRIPVGVVGGINDPAFAESVLAEGKADYVAVARQAIADPDWVNKIREGREEDIRPCIRCGLCMDCGRRRAITHNKDLEINNTASFSRYCSVNPLYAQNRYKARILYPPSRKKHVIVVGGGIAGMQAAVAAAERGHIVTLYEKSDKLGGQLLIADKMWFKAELSRLREYLITQLKKSGVTVHLGTEATPDMIRAADPDAVIVAVGSRQAVPPIPGLDGSNVFYAWDVLGHESVLGRRVVIIGGGSVGCEMAIHLAGLGRHVTILEMGEYLAANAELTERMCVLNFLDSCAVERLTGARCLGIEGKVVRVETSSGVQRIEADSFIVCAGVRPLQEERDQFEDTAFDVIPVGDCDQTAGGTIRVAISEGWAAGTLLV